MIVLKRESASADLASVLRERECWDRLAESWVKENKAVLSLKLNIPGPEKRSALLDRFFILRLTDIRNSLRARGICAERELLRQNACGVSYLALMEASPAEMKIFCLQEEEKGRGGRLLDLDVRDGKGRQLKRADFGRTARTCLICGEEAFSCARSRRHSLPELTAACQRLAEAELLEKEGQRLAFLAAKSALFEALAAPKPGLVDRFSSGRHQDMDIYSFAETSLLLKDYLVELGAITAERLAAGAALDEDFLLELQNLALEAENRAFQAVSANTQNGLIFAFSLIIPSLLSLYQTSLNENPPFLSSRVLYDEAALIERIKSVYTPLYERDKKAGRPMNGARALAYSGFRSVITSYRHDVIQYQRKGLSLEDTALICLLRIMASEVDRNILRRGGEEALRALQLKAGEILSRLEASLKAPDEEAMRALKKELEDLGAFLEEKDLSPGGAADILCLSLFFAYLDLDSHRGA